ncbi:MAG TPA: heavy metal-associated domain-containing protein [Candidatus Tectomicrobia bacterium]
MEGLLGVKQSEVNLTTKQAVVRYEMGNVTVEQMLAAIKQVGFSARLHQ